jgi:hypothetical protein
VLFSSLYDWAARKYRGQEVTKEEIYETIKENFAISSTTILEPAKKAIRQIADPDAYETNYFGGLIVDRNLRDYSPGQQYDEASSAIAKWVGDKFNISPHVVDYILDSYTGVLGDVYIPASSDRGMNILAPFERRFITDPDFKSDSQNKFYTLLDESVKKANDYNKINQLPTNGPDNVVTPLEEKANELKKIAREMSELRKEQKELKIVKGKSDEELESDEEKLRRLQKAINKLAEDAVRDFK